jgi:hypothetical protein
MSLAVSGAASAESSDRSSAAMKAMEDEPDLSIAGFNLD